MKKYFGNIEFVAKICSEKQIITMCIFYENNYILSLNLLNIYVQKVYHLADWNRYNYAFIHN